MNDYHNPELQKILESKITPEKYKQYAPILHEIMQRRAFEFDFSIDRMEKEVDSLIKNLNTISYSNSSDKKLGENVMAVYNHKEKEITINEELMREEQDTMAKYSTLTPEQVELWTGQQLYGTLTHEVYHAITTWDDKKVGLEFEEYGFKIGRELTEAFTESAASRTSKIKYPNDIIKGYSRTSGYETTTFATNMLAYAMGTTEKELLAHGLSNKEELLEFMKSINPNASEGIMENEFGLMESIFTIANNYSKGIITENFTQADKDGNAQGFGHIFMRSYNVLKNSLLTDNRPLDMNVLGEIYARERKLNSIMSNSLSDLRNTGFLDDGGVASIVQGRTSETISQIQKMILGRYVSYKRGFEPKSIEDICAREGYLTSLDKYYDKNKVNELLGEFSNVNYAEIEQSLLTDAQQQPEFFSYLQKINRDDFAMNVVWDTKVYNDMYHDFESSKNKQPEVIETKTAPSKEEDDDAR